MRFWDSSCLIPLIVREDTSDLLMEVLREDRDIVVWWETEVECIGGVAAKFREQNFTDREVDQSLDLLAILHENWLELQPSPEVKATASRLLFSHYLKAADAMQLASALLWCDGDSREAMFVCQDNQLRRAARTEGFIVTPSGDELRRARR